MHTVLRMCMIKSKGHTQQRNQKQIQVCPMQSVPTVVCCSQLIVKEDGLVATDVGIGIMSIALISRGKRGFLFVTTVCEWCVEICVVVFF